MEQAFKEVTVWDDGATTVNHTYLFDGDKVVAYIRYGTSEAFWFKNPIKIDKRGRKFAPADLSQFYNTKNVFITPSDIVEVQGSKGAVYFVNTTENTCTCPGYTYRGTCKHVKELEPA